MFNFIKDNLFICSNQFSLCYYLHLWEYSLYYPNNISFKKKIRISSSRHNQCFHYARPVLTNYIILGYFGLLNKLLNNWMDSMRAAIGTLLAQQLKVQIENRLSWGKSIYVATKNQHKLDPII